MSFIKRIWQKLNETFAWDVLIVVAIGLFLYARVFIFSSYTVEGDSMNPTLTSQSRVWTSSYTEDLHQGDVIVFNHKDRTLIKRVFAVPGDVVEEVGDEVHVNEGLLDLSTPDVSNGPRVKHQKRIVLDSDEYYVLGDNFEDSEDSRYFGVIKESQIKGRVTYQYWPSIKVVQ